MIMDEVACIEPMVTPPMSLGERMKRYCLEPWLSTAESNPPLGKMVLMATYDGSISGSIKGYRIELGYCFGLTTLNEKGEEETKAAWAVIGDEVNMYQREAPNGRYKMNGVYANQYTYDKNDYMRVPLSKNTKNVTMRVLSGDDTKIESPDYYMLIPSIK